VIVQVFAVGVARANGDRKIGFFNNRPDDRGAARDHA
jgi:hypothetical protein